jgi:hypothetical protein
VVANALAWIAGLVVVFAAIGIAPGNSPVAKPASRTHERLTPW